MSPAATSTISSTTTQNGFHDKASAGVVEREVLTANGGVEQEPWTSAELSQALDGMEGDFPLDEAVVEGIDDELSIHDYSSLGADLC